MGLGKVVLRKAPKNQTGANPPNRHLPLEKREWKLMRRGRKGGKGEGASRKSVRDGTSPYEGGGGGQKSITRFCEENKDRGITWSRW